MAAPVASGVAVVIGAGDALGGAGFAAFAGAKHGLRALAQSMARELGPTGIHVGHVVIDGRIDSDAVRARFAEPVAEMADDGLLAPDAIAEAFWNLHQQPRDAWTWEIDIRPWTEAW